MRPHALHTRETKKRGANNGGACRRLRPRPLRACPRWPPARAHDKGANTSTETRNTRATPNRLAFANAVRLVACAPATLGRCAASGAAYGGFAKRQHSPERQRLASFLNRPRAAVASTVRLCLHVGRATQGTPTRPVIRPAERASRATLFLCAGLLASLLSPTHIFSLFVRLGRSR